MDHKYCPYCLPTKKRGHFFDKIEYCLKKFFVFEFSDVRVNKAAVLKVLKVLKTFKMIGFDKKPDREKIKNRSYIFFEEAQRMKIEIFAIKFLGNYLGEYVFKYKSKAYRYTGTPLSLLPKKKIDIDDKARVKRILHKYGVPVSEGKSFWLKLDAFQYGEKLAYPLVVKPNSGSLSHHVTVDIKTADELKSAIQIAFAYQPEIIVEKYYEGNLYRATVVDQKKVYLCQKKLASIVGDGKSTIEELVERKNICEKRGKAYETLQAIRCDEQLKALLSKSNLNFKSILEKDQPITLSDKFTLASGCEIINVKELAHPDDIEMFLEAAKILGQPLIGFDFICPDISQSYKTQKCAIIEANSFPYLDMHQFPTKGLEEKVAADVWNIVLDYLEKDAKLAR